MKYELELFSRVISGDLSPLNTGTSNFKNHVAFLKVRFGQCTKHFKVRLKKKPAGEFIYCSHHEYAFHELDQAIYLDPKDADDDPETLDLLIIESLSRLKLRRTDIIESFHKTSKNFVDLEITAKINYEAMDQNEAKFQYYNLMLHEETDRIKHSFNQEVFNLRNEKEIELYVQNHQIALETQTEMLFELLKKRERKRVYEVSGNYTLMDIYKTIYIHLDKLLGHIEKHFTKYLDINAQIPYRSRIISTLETQKKLTLIHAVLKNRNIDSYLQEIIFVPLYKLSRLTKEEHFTYQDLIYHKKLLVEIYKVFSSDGTNTTDLAIILILRRMNFNSLKFFNFIIAKIRQELEGIENTKDKLELLYRHIKEYNQLPVKSKFAYNNHLLPLKDQVIIWLKEEVYFLKKRMKNNGQEANASQSNLPGGAKIITKMSVAQSSYFFKVMYEIGMISNKNQREIFRFLSNNISTIKQENISFDSVSAKYYNVEHTTRLAVKDVIIRMLNHINKTRFQ